MSSRFCLLLALLLGIAVSQLADAADRNSPRDDGWRAISRRVDELLAQRWQAEGIQRAEPASDAEFLRRAYLDLTGRIPRVNEVRNFLNDTRPDRRAAVINELLQKPDHATHLANTWRGFLLPDGANVQQFGGALVFENWLRAKFADNEPYNQVVTELLLAEGQINQSGPVLFYTSLELKPEELAASTSRAFLGVQIQCAQCHNHPFDHWTQKDFWGFAAFFARLNRPQTPQQFVAAVSDVGVGEVKLPNQDEVVPPRYLRGDVVADSADVTRRQNMAAWLTAAENPYFARAAVNRVWALLFGRGIVEPVDDLGEHNLPSHPQLLDELADHFVRSGFDVRGLVRTLANTQAYQMSSAAAQSESPRPELFHRMAIKSLTAEQLYDCLAVATCRREGVQAGGGASAFGGQIDQSRQAFLNKFSAPAGSITDYHAGIPQALTLMNGNLISSATDLQTSDVLVSLQAPFFTDRKRVETLFVATLSRLPNEAEQAKFEDYLSARSSTQEKAAALSDMLWALLNSAEFTLNH